MSSSISLYLVSGFVAVAALYSGLTNANFIFIKDPRSAVIILTIAGFAMCSTGVLGRFVTKAPTHPLSILGYILGITALAIGVANIFKLRLPLISDPRDALIAMAVVIVAKVIIARFNFLIK